jgi:HD-GYP domain-containing protein (c-di-GMP phosphodiesterase class II)
MQIMHTHPQIAYDLLLPIEYLRPALSIPYYHHEKWDGSGYPHGLKGDAIPLEARIFAIIDVYDALSYDRPYRKAWEKQRVLEYIKAESGKHFDPAVVSIFMKEIGKDDH